MTNGKGDTQRPRAISREEWDARWLAIFEKPTTERLTEMRDLLNSVDRVTEAVVDGDATD